MLKTNRKLISWLLTAVMAVGSAAAYTTPAYAAEEMAAVGEESIEVENESKAERIEQEEPNTLEEGVVVTENTAESTESAESFEEDLSNPSSVASADSASAGEEDNDASEETFTVTFHTGEDGYYEVWNDESQLTETVKEVTDTVSVGEYLGNCSYYHSLYIEAGVKKAFDCWYYDSACTQPADYYDTLTSDVELYAGYVDMFTVTFHADENSYYEVYNVDTGEYEPSDIMQKDYRSTEEYYPSWYVQEQLICESGYCYEDVYLDEGRTQPAEYYIDLSDDIDLYVKTDKSVTLILDAGEYGYFEVWNNDISDYERVSEKTLTLPVGKEIESYTDFPFISSDSKKIFNGWYYDSSLTQPVEYDDLAAGDLTLYAGYVDKITVTFHADENCYYEGYNGETGEYEPADTYVIEIRAEEHFYPSSYSEYNIICEDGYCFEGFYLDEERTQAAEYEFALTEDIDLYVKTVESVTVTVNAGEYGYFEVWNSETQSYDHVKERSFDTPPGRHSIGDWFASPEVPEGEGKVFDCWYYDSACTNEVDGDDIVTEDIVIYAGYKDAVFVTYHADANSYFSEYNGNTGEYEKTDTKVIRYPLGEYSSLYYDAEVFIECEEGYTFWDAYLDEERTQSIDDYPELTHNIDVYIKTVEEVTLTMHTGEYGHFEVWNVETGDYDKVSEYVKKVPAGAEIDWYSSTPTANSDVNLFFERWYYDSDLIEPANGDDVIEGDLDLYAGWTEGVTVTFHADDNSWFPWSKDGETGQYQEFEAEYAKDTKLWARGAISSWLQVTDGYILEGVYLDEARTVSANDEDITLTDDIDLYVKTAEKATITCVAGEYGYYQAWNEDIDDYEETAVETVDAPCGAELYRYLRWPAPKDDAKYIFDGWYLDPEFTQRADTNMQITQDITVYAKWSEKLTVTFHADENCYYKQPGNTGGEQGQYQEYQLKMAKNQHFWPQGYATQSLIYSDGYTIAGVYLDEARTIPAEEITLTENIDLYVKTGKAITVTYDVGEYGYLTRWNDEIGISEKVSVYPTVVVSGSSFIWYEPEHNEGVNKYFEGWYYDPEYSKRVEYGALITQDLTVYAKWADAVSITYHAEVPCFSRAGSDQGEEGAFDTFVDLRSSNYGFHPLDAVYYFMIEGYGIDEVYLDPAHTIKAEEYYSKIEGDMDFYVTVAPTITVTYETGDQGYLYSYSSPGGMVYVHTYDVAAIKGKAIRKTNYFDTAYAMKGNKIRFAGWYTDKNYTNKVTGDTSFDKDTTLYAKWEKTYTVTIHTGENAWYYDDNGEKTHTMVFMPDGYSESVHIYNPETAENCRVWGIYEDSAFTKELPNRYNYKPTKDIDVYVKTGDLFKDVRDKASSFYNPIYFAANVGITTGYPDNTFRPDDPCTRGQAVTFIWRGFGRQEAEAGTVNTFTDIPGSGDFYNAIMWAKSRKITTGYNSTTFGTNDSCTRGQIVTFLWRAFGSPEPQNTTTKLKDVDPKSPFYKAILWAAENKITTGFADNTFRQDDTCTRGQIVTFIYRAMYGQG